MKLPGNISYKMKIYNFIEMVDYIKEYLHNNDAIIIDNRFSIIKSTNIAGFPKFRLIDNVLTKSIAFSHIWDYIMAKLEYFNISEYDYYDILIKKLELWYNSIIIERTYYE